MHSLRPSFETSPQVIDQITEPIDYGEVLRYLGYPVDVEPNERLREMLDYWLEESAKLASPWATYTVLPVIEIGRRTLRLRSAGGETEFQGAIGEFLDASQQVIVFVATGGPALERRASELLKENEPLAAMILNAVGAERAEAAEMAVINKLREQVGPAGYALTMPYSPGYCGMKLTEQRKLFAIFSEENIRVQLTEACLMQPIKSVSGLVGIGPADKIIDKGSPCERCELRNCAMRRV